MDGLRAERKLRARALRAEWAAASAAGGAAQAAAFRAALGLLPGETDARLGVTAERLAMLKSAAQAEGAGVLMFRAARGLSVRGEPAGGLVLRWASLGAASDLAGVLAEAGRELPASTLGGVLRRTVAAGNPEATGLALAWQPGSVSAELLADLMERVRHVSSALAQLPAARTMALAGPNVFNYAGVAHVLLGHYAALGGDAGAPLAREMLRVAESPAALLVKSAAKC